MKKINAVTAGILTQNQGRDGARLALKLAAIRRDEFAFFRGTNPLFLSFLPRGHALFRAPTTLISGDLHLENFGAFKGDNRLCYFDVNDFDEACRGPFTLDIVRFLACIHAAAPGLELKPVQARALCGRFLEAYRAAVNDGKPRWIERSLADGVFRALLRRAMGRTRLELLDRLTRRRDGVRRLRVDGRRAFALQAQDARPLREFMARLRRRSATPRFYSLLDAAHRIAGNGSLGLPRFSLLVRGRGSPDGNFVLDLKAAAPSAVARWLARPQPQWPDEAARVVTIQRIAQAIAPALLDAVSLRGRPFLLKELQPSIDRLDLSQWQAKPRRITEAIEGMGRVAAWAHLRGCGHHGAASAEALQAYVAGRGWGGSAQRLAAAAAKRNGAAWKIYAGDYDRGAVAVASGLALSRT